MASKKIRFAAAIDAKGEWHVCGWSGAEETSMMDSAIEPVGDGERRYWLEAELELPNVVEVTEAVDSVVEA